MDQMILPSPAAGPGSWPTIVHRPNADLFMVPHLLRNEEESTPMPHTVRLATPDDVPTLMTGLRALAHDLGEPFSLTEAQLSAALSDPTGLGFGVMAGHLAVALVQPQISTAAGGVLGYVSDLWVAREVRGSGLGSALLAAAARESTARWGAIGLRLAVQGDARRLRALYARLGLVLHPRDRNAVLTGAPFRALQDVA